MCTISSNSYLLIIVMKNFKFNSHGKEVLIWSNNSQAPEQKICNASRRSQKSGMASLACRTYEK